MNIPVVVLGGGTAGWLTALYTKALYPNLSVTVVEDPGKPPIIAGESGGFALSMIYDRLGIEFAHWGASVGATPKLGGKFIGWNGKDSVFYHSLITPHYTKAWSKDFDSYEERYYFLKQLIGMGINICDTVPTAHMLKNNLVPFDDYGAVVDHIYPMWHFDSRANADYLKQYGLKKGIELVEGKYVGAVKNTKGNISKILLEDGRELSAQWFFDCSGFARLLLEKEMRGEVLDQSQYFPACAVLPWWSDTELNTATIATTMNAGWSWKIGLRHRTGQGYLYDPNHLTEDQALQEIEQKFGPVEPVARLKFTPSIHKESQIGNVFGIGLSTGFMEPLEANGTGIIVDQLLALEHNWNPNFVYEDCRAAFNKEVLDKYLSIRDFLSLHYRAKGYETDFWKEQADPNRVPDSLKQRLEEFEEYYKTGRFDFEKYQEGFSLESWLTVIQGLDLIDTKLISVGDKGPFIDNYYKETIKPYNKIYNRCIGIDKWINNTTTITE